MGALRRLMMRKRPTLRVVLSASRQPLLTLLHVTYAQWRGISTVSTNPIDAPRVGLGEADEAFARTIMPCHERNIDHTTTYHSLVTQRALLVG